MFIEGSLCMATLTKSGLQVPRSRRLSISRQSESKSFLRENEMSFRIYIYTTSDVPLGGHDVKEDRQLERFNSMREKKMN